MVSGLATGMTMTFRTLILSATAFGCLALVQPAQAASPPKQPDKGPGGAEYPIQTADVVREAVGAGAKQAFIFRPSRGFAGPRPVIVFGHAFNAFNPRLYGAWIDHLARQGQ